MIQPFNPVYLAINFPPYYNPSPEGMSSVLLAVLQRTFPLNKYDGGGELARTVCPSWYDSGDMRNGGEVDEYPSVSCIDQ